MNPRHLFRALVLAPLSWLSARIWPEVPRPEMPAPFVFDPDKLPPIERAVWDACEPRIRLQLDASSARSRLWAVPKKKIP